jgi:hypothetical protein
MEEITISSIFGTLIILGCIFGLVIWLQSFREDSEGDKK